MDVMVDEARCHKKQQLSLCIRYIDNKLTPHERFLMFKDCSNKRTAEELAGLIISALENLSINELPVIAQTYDGANVMSGQYGGLQTKIREKYPQAVYFHCYAYKLCCNGCMSNH